MLFKRHDAENYYKSKFKKKRHFFLQFWWGNPICLSVKDSLKAANLKISQISLYIYLDNEGCLLKPPPQILGCRGKKGTGVWTQPVWQPWNIFLAVQQFGERNGACLHAVKDQCDQFLQGSIIYAQHEEFWLQSAEGHRFTTAWDGCSLFTRSKVAGTHWCAYTQVLHSLSTTSQDMQKCKICRCRNQHLCTLAGEKPKRSSHVFLTGPEQRWLKSPEYMCANSRDAICFLFYQRQRRW